MQDFSSLILKNETLCQATIVVVFRLETPKHKVLFTKSSYCQRILGSKEGLLTYRRKRTTSFSISNCTEK